MTIRHLMSHTSGMTYGFFSQSNWAETQWAEASPDLGIIDAYTPQLDAIALCRRLRLTSIASLPEYPPRGAAVGFAPAGDKSVIIINLSAARAEGADFSSRLLGMSKVIR